MEAKIIGKEISLAGFCEALGSSVPAPGGGGAAALCAALGTELMRMVGSLTVGKKKYAAVEAEMLELMEQCDTLANRFLGLIEKDATCFLPLAKAYALPKDAPNRQTVLEEATMIALEPPMEMLELLSRTASMLNVFAEKGSRLAVSDAGCAAALIRSAAEAAILNVFINTKSLMNRQTAGEINQKAQALLEGITKEADKVYVSVSGQLKGEGNA